MGRAGRQSRRREAGARNDGQGIRSYVWAPDIRHLLYLQDAGGNENTHLSSVDTRTAVIRDLTGSEQGAAIGFRAITLSKYRLAGAGSSPLSGWMGHQAPFDFQEEYSPADGIRRFLCGPPPILGIAALEAGLDLFLEADRQALYQKGQQLCALFIDRVEEECAGFGLNLVTPRDPQQRGSHVSFSHNQAHEIMQALIERGVIGDFRAPDNLRFGFTPLYTGYEDVFVAAGQLRSILVGEVWREPRFEKRLKVT